MSEQVKLDELNGESDVEQKFLYPLLIAQAPNGFGFDHANIQTKRNLRKFVIDKGAKQKSYFPDYVVTHNGFPFLVCEAKERGADLDEAFREARLYASELNALYPSGVQPAKWVVATNGDFIYCGFSDQASPEIKLPFSELDIYNAEFSKLVSNYGKEAIEDYYSQLLPKIRPRRFWKPRKLVGGISVQREEVGTNSFGATISSDFATIFNPKSLTDRNFIAKNAYISSKRRERYVDPIDRVIRASASISEARSKTIDDTATPNEIVKVLRGTRELEHQVMLIVGSAGAGKTSFIDHLREVALPRDVRDKTVWLHIDMNPAPISRGEIYGWLRQKIIDRCVSLDPKIDHDELETLKAVHAPQLSQFRKGPGRLYEKNKDLYDIKMAEKIEDILKDRHIVAQNHAAYCSVNRGKLLIIVLDNCDKRLRDEQLLMFEAAQWIQKEFKALVILPLREETYDNHHQEPPLDTALKDLVFRIEPPLFQKILQTRIQLAMQAINSQGKKMLRYELPNGMSVEYPASEQSFYLSSILRSVFEHDMHVRRLIVGLAGRNMRRAMEIFLEFCTSGHISEDHILKIVSSEGRYVLPLALVTTVLLRTNLRYYDSERAYLKNLYAALELDSRPNFFARVLILRILDEKSNSYGPKRLKGYVRVEDLRVELGRYGVEQVIFTREIESLARGFCILSEDFKTDGIGDDDIVSLAPAGRVHLQICSDPYYLAAISEDTWFTDQAQADAIANRIKDPQQHYLPRTTLYNAKACLAELQKNFERENSSYKTIYSDNAFAELANLTKTISTLNQFERTLVSGPWAQASVKYPPQTIHSGRIANHTKFGIFVDLEPGVTGLIHSSILPHRFEKLPQFQKGQKISVKVADLDYVARRMGLAPN